MSAAGAASGQLVIPKKKLDSIQARISLSGITFSHTTPNGKVYIMPFDHMRCLVPDMRKVAPMTVVKPRIPEIMPNAIQAAPPRKEERKSEPQW